MSQFGMFASPMTVATLTSATTNGTTANFTIPLAQSYRIALECSTASGTGSPVLDVIIATSLDGGTTYDEILKFSQLTTGGGRQMIIRPYLGIGDAATETAIGTIGVLDLAAGAGVVNNGPIDNRYMKVRYLVGGTTSPVFTFAVKVLAIPQNDASNVGA